MQKIKEKRLDLLRFHRENGTVEVRKLPAGTRITLETATEVYELEVGTPKLGVVLIASDRRFPGRDKAVVSGSFDSNAAIFLPEIIGQGLSTVLKRPYARVVRTGPVLAATIRGKDDSYTYEMWNLE
jgi:hypothetical protein